VLKLQQVEYRWPIVCVCHWQVLPSNVANYERCRGGGGMQTAANVAVANGPRAVAARVAQLKSSSEVAARSPPSAEPPDIISDVSCSTAGGGGEQKEDVVAVGVKPPVVHDVKLCTPRNSADVLSARLRRTLRSWRSTESIDRLIAPATLQNAADGGGGGSSGQVARSSFVDPSTSASSTSTTCRSVYIDLGEYQTLLKHGLSAIFSIISPWQDQSM